MVKIELDTSRLSLEELSNVGRVLRERCEECIEGGVPAPCRHVEEVRSFLAALAAAVEREREAIEHRRHDEALAVDPVTGEAVAGA